MVNKLQKIKHNIADIHIRRRALFCFCQLLLVSSCLLLTTACSLTKRVPAGQFMLYRDKINLENKDKRINKDDISLLFKQHPNKSYQAFGVLFYNLAKPGDSNWINRVVRNIGVAPVIYDSTLNAQSIYQISRYLFAKGHFHSEVSIDTNIVTKKRIRLIYNVKTNDFYRINNVIVNVVDDSLTDVLKDWKLDIKKNDLYDLNKLDVERMRLETFLRNEGYFKFNISQVSYLLDTALGNNTMDIGMLIVPPARGEHTKKYFINDINILPLPRGNDSISYEDTTLFHFPKEKEIFTFLNADYINVKPKHVASKLLLKQGDSYSFAKTQRSFENMSDLRYFRNVNFQFEEDTPDSNLLNLNIQLTKAPAMNWGMDFEYTNTSGLQGLALTTSFTHRNIFKGGETLKINLRGGVELQILFDNKNTANSKINVVNNWDVGAGVSLEFPRFLMPISHEVEAKYIRPKTIINSNFSYQHKTSYYDRVIINASIGYFWTMGKITHQFFPVDLSIVKIYPTEYFKGILDTFSLSHNSRRLMYQYQDHFISATRYNLIYENHYFQKIKNYDYARLSAEIAGNILCAGFAAVKAPKNDVEQYNIWGMPFSQYLRLEVEYRHYWTFSPYHLIAVRMLAGFGYAYSNSKTLPYEKGFFAGGTNLIRAWPLYRLGPGSYYDSDRPLIEQYGDIVSVNNIEYRFPIYKIVKGAAFVDFGNIWLRRKTDEFPKGEFSKNFYKDIAVGAGIGLRLDFDYFVIRLDAAVPLRDPSGKYGGNSAWMADKLKFKNIILNFGIGYPF